MNEITIETNIKIKRNYPNDDGLRLQQTAGGNGHAKFVNTRVVNEILRVEKLDSSNKTKYIINHTPIKINSIYGSILKNGVFIDGFRNKYGNSTLIEFCPPNRKSLLDYDSCRIDLITGELTLAWLSKPSLDYEVKVSYDYALKVSDQSSRGYRGDSYMDSGYFYCPVEINID